MSELSQRERVTTLLYELIDANNRAEAADRRLQRKVKWLQDYCRVNRYSEDATRKKFKVDYDFNDLLDDYRYRLGEVQRISATLVGVTAAAAYLSS